MSNMKQVFIVILAINVLLYATGLRVIETVDNNINELVNVDDNNNLYQNGNGIRESENLQNASETLTVFRESGSNGIFDLLDGLNIINEFFIFIVNILFTPFALFTGGTLPPIFGLILGLPLLMSAIIYAAYFIRGIR